MVFDASQAEIAHENNSIAPRFKKVETDVSVISKDLLIKFDNPSP
jgi:hypothetical protein